MRYRLIALALVIAAAAALSAQPTYRLHENGELWVDRNEYCSGIPCVKWHLLDNHPATKEITAGLGVSGGDPLKGFPDYSPLYQRRSDGAILLYTGTPCGGGSCPGWKVLDKNDDNPAVSIVAAGVQLYQRRRNGEIWSYDVKQCTLDGPECPGWQRLDHSDTVEITAAGRPPDAPRLYQRRGNGDILRYTGTPCSDGSCWQVLEKNSDALELTATAATGSAGPVYALYQRRSNGIWRYRYTDKPCVGASCPRWEQIDNRQDTISIVANHYFLYQLRNDGSIWVYSFRPCIDSKSCPGWLLLDKNVSTRQIAAGGRSLYKRHDNGAIWRYPDENEWCEDESSCLPWLLLYDPAASTIASTQN